MTFTHTNTHKSKDRFSTSFSYLWLFQTYFHTYGYTDDGMYSILQRRPHKLGFKEEKKIYYNICIISFIKKNLPLVYLKQHIQLLFLQLQDLVRIPFEILDLGPNLCGAAFQHNHKEISKLNKLLICTSNLKSEGIFKWLLNFLHKVLLISLTKT